MARECAIEEDQPVKNKTLGWREFIKLCFKAALQVLEHHRNQADVSDLITDKSISNKLRTQRTEVHHRCPANERPNESDHEVNRMIGGKDAQVPHSRPKRIPRGQRFALFEVIFMGEHAALGASTCTGRINNARCVLALSRNEDWIALAAEFFPAERSSKVGTQRRFGNQYGFQLMLFKFGLLHHRPP